MTTVFIRVLGRDLQRSTLSNEATEPEGIRSSPVNRTLAPHEGTISSIFCCLPHLLIRIVPGFIGLLPPWESQSTDRNPHRRIPRLSPVKVIQRMAADLLRERILRGEYFSDRPSSQSSSSTSRQSHGSSPFTQSTQSGDIRRNEPGRQEHSRQNLDITQ